MGTRTLFAAVFCGVIFVTPLARAAGDNDGGAAAAESLFQEARKAMDAKHYGDACPKFAASQKLAPAIGTLLNLADCYEKNNQLASAWARFHEAIALAQRNNRTNREQTARERADKLEPRLIRLSITAHGTPPSDVKLDGNTIDTAVLGTPIPVDAGKHTLEASAKGKRTYTTTFEVTEKLKSPTVDIPALADDEAKPATPEKLVEPPKEPPAKWGTQKTIAVVVAGAGVVGLVVGIGFGVRTSATWKNAKAHCTGTLCDETGVDLAGKAKNAGNIATIASVAGGVLLVGGAVLYLTAAPPKSSTTALRVGIGPGSLQLAGSFQ